MTATKATLSVITEIQSVPFHLDDGEYPGKWLGYRVTIEIGRYRYHLITTTNYQEIERDCLVKVNGKEITVELQG